MRKQQGFIQNLVLPALILMGIVLYGMKELANNNQAGIAIAKSVDASRAQLDQTRQALNWCSIAYPAGNNGQTYTTTAQNHVVYPASPADGSWISLRTLACPGAPTSTIWAASHQFLPTPGSYLAEWQYRNTSTGIYVKLATAAPGDSYGRAVLAQIASRLPLEQRAITNSGDSLEITYMQ